MKPFPIFFLTLCFLLTACSTAQQTETPRDQTSVQLSWIHTIEFAGFYEAVDKGYYTAEHLDVELNEGGFDENGDYINPIQRVVDGEVDFGVMDGQTLLVAKADGAPIVAIAAIYQRSPIAFVSLADSNIVRPEDLVGSTVVMDLATSAMVFRSLLASKDIEPSSVNMVQRTDYTIAPLLSGEADVIDGWITNEGVALSLAGEAYNTVLVSDYGIDTYANVIFAREDTLTDRAALTTRFLRATLQGIHAAVDNPAEAASLAVQYNDERNLEAETEGMNRSVPLLNPAGSEIGMMTADVWETTYEMLLREGVLSEPMDIDTVYSLDILEQIYAT